jgi:site-specific DNA-cytosine methylase
VRYIVRRLTPTECARLQGFPDKWGHYPEKDSLTDEEYRFWVKVQQTHAIINGKKPWKDDVKADTVLKWYNGLHTDSAEYKMWGNGIALPCARIPLRGIAQLGAKTLASLFDGSGGFPLAGRLEGIEPRWSSEVEPYPIAVTVHQFGGLG